MNKPKLSHNQYAVGQAELNTGYVLKNNKSFFLTGDDIKDAYEIFNSYDQAKEFSIKKVQNNPDIECWIYDHAGKIVYGCDKDGDRNLTP